MKNDIIEQEKTARDLNMSYGNYMAQSCSRIKAAEYDGLDLDKSCDLVRKYLSKSAENFVSAGFFIKKIKSEKLYLEKGYADLWECAQYEFGLNMTAASRCMSFNDRYSVGGNTPYIGEEYKSYSKSQLQEMLYLNQEQEDIVKHIGPKSATCEKIRKIKAESKIPEVKQTNADKIRSMKNEDLADIIECPYRKDELIPCEIAKGVYAKNVILCFECKMGWLKSEVK